MKTRRAPTYLQRASLALFMSAATAAGVEVYAVTDRLRPDSHRLTVDPPLIIWTVGLVAGSFALDLIAGWRARRGRTASLAALRLRRPFGTAKVRRMLDLSTGHLPQAVIEDLAAYDGVISHERGEHGALLWVPDDPAGHAADYDGFPAEVLAVQVYARRYGCDYVLLDRDADRDPGLPFWDAR